MVVSMDWKEEHTVTGRFQKVRQVCTPSGDNNIVQKESPGELCASKVNNVDAERNGMQAG